MKRFESFLFEVLNYIKSVVRTSLIGRKVHPTVLDVSPIGRRLKIEVPILDLLVDF